MGKLHVVETSVSYREIYRFSAVPMSFLQIENLIIKSTWLLRGLGTAEMVLRNKNRARGLQCPGFQTRHRTTVSHAA